MNHRILAILALAVVDTLEVRVAEACTPPPPVAPFALPRSSTGISTASSIHVISEERPAWIEVTADGTPVKTDGVAFLGDVYFPSSSGKLWRVLGLDLTDHNGTLIPSSQYVVSATISGKKTELTRFSTAAGYDKKQGTAPILRSVRLWRVHYATRRSSCVAADYHAFIELDYSAAVVPDTSPDSVLYTIWLYPKTGGQTERRYFTGKYLFKGAAPQAPDYSPSIPNWPTDVDPTREYCVKMTASGNGDLARLAMESDIVCTPVTVVESDTKLDGNDSDSGCSVCMGRAGGSLGDRSWLLLLIPLVVIRRKVRMPEYSTDGEFGKAG